MGEAVRVLLVEDQEAFRAAIASELEREPEFEIVRQAASLTQAREMLEDVDVAILDLGLPDGRGTDIIPELRAANANVRVLVLTATPDPSELARAVEHGADAVLDKIACLGQVMQAVRPVLAGQRLVRTEGIDSHRCIQPSRRRR
jgi:DNA-binding NarL/FixJ family response regulator